MVYFPNLESFLRGQAFVSFIFVYLIVLTVETLLRPYYKYVFSSLLSKLKFQPN